MMYHDGPERPTKGYEAYWCDSPRAMLQAVAE